MGKGYRTGLVIILVLTLAILSTYVLSHFVFKFKKSTGFSKVVDKISKYDYTLDERDSKLMREKFKDLKKVLKADQVNYDEYAKLLAQMYIIDLYDINNKVNKYDVPCLEYIYKSEQDKFKKMIKTQFYSQLVDNSDGNRKQELPSVKSIEVISSDESKVDVSGKSYDGYIIVLSWEYDKDLGFDKKSEVRIAKDNNKLYVIKHSPIID
ncbi:MAG: hypothetical protein IKX00_05325 [Bacilli bacterium]|nr:hypothetical protein [Bacilli bacterium]